jgi:hypothetical protein
MVASGLFIPGLPKPLKKPAGYCTSRLMFGLFLLLSRIFQPKSWKAETNGNFFNWLLKCWKASIWKNELKAEKLI